MKKRLVKRPNVSSVHKRMEALTDASLEGSSVHEELSSQLEHILVLTLGHRVQGGKTMGSISKFCEMEMKGWPHVMDLDSGPFRVSDRDLSLRNHPLSHPLMQPPTTTPTTPPTKTNMTAAEMVLDMNTIGHNARYWCLPPMREDSDEVVAIGNRYEFHLVSQGQQVGVWKNWTVAESMVSGYPGGAHKGHHLYGLVLSTMGGSRPGGIQYFAIWSTSIVYSTKYAVKHPFDDAVEDRKDPELLLTDDFEVALVYAEGEI
ncbi:hypothetical protein B0H14DRAFT_2586255 [Mycena olivaceomarginata]|nr:hypothetical protein B0H14DRAFT_2586255 [Mycena olivaceomarginata]